MKFSCVDGNAMYCLCLNDYEHDVKWRLNDVKSCDYVFNVLNFW